MVYRPKWQIALELYDHAIKNGIHFDWMTFDEGYGSKPDFLRGLSARGQKFVGEVPRSFTGWLKPPRVVTPAVPQERAWAWPQGPSAGQRQPAGATGRGVAG